MTNINFPSTATIISQSSFKPNQSSILGPINPSYIDGVNIYIVNNSAFSSSYITISVTTNNNVPITVYNSAFSIPPQTVLIVQNVYNVSNTSVNVLVAENNNTNGYVVYDTIYTSEVPNSSTLVSLAQFNPSTTEPVITGTGNTSSEQLTQLQSLITSQINNLNAQVNALSNEIQGSFTALQTASQYSSIVNNLTNQVSTLITELNAINGNISMLSNTTSNIPILQTGINNIQTNIENTQNNIAGLSSVIDSYYKDYVDSTNTTNEAIANIQDIYTSYNEAIVTISNLSSDITVLQSNQTKMMGLINSIIKIENISDLSV